MKLRSCIYECRVMHQRLLPAGHRFEYRLFYFSLDLDELDELTKKIHGFSRNRWNLYEFRDRDHLTLPDLPGKSVKEHVLAWISRQGLDLPAETRITLVTLPRVLGYIFNPVSFYFCADAAGKPLCAVAQVGNTFREMKPYLISGTEREGYFHLITPKHFYVSPFSDLDLHFDFKLHVPDAHLQINIDDRKGDTLVLLSALNGERREFSTARLAWLTLKFPVVTIKVIFLIHWQALRLWWKGFAFHRKSANPDLQRDVFNPHSSLKDKSA